MVESGRMLPLLTDQQSILVAHVISQSCQDQTPGCGSLYNRGMNENFFAELSAWLTQAGLAGASKATLCVDSAIVASRLAFRWGAVCSLSTLDRRAGWAILTPETADREKVGQMPCSAPPASSSSSVQAQ
jgi:hypothetical protein